MLAGDSDDLEWESDEKLNRFNSRYVISVGK